jgi:hypothetical protein
LTLLVDADELADASELDFDKGKAHSVAYPKYFSLFPDISQIIIENNS